jgi:micrococcal nuclease
VRPMVGRRSVTAWLVLLAVTTAFATFAEAQQANTQTIVAYVTRVVDGDTIHAMIGNQVETIRYIGINTPETHHPRLGAQPGGQEATEVNRQLVEGKWVQLTLDVQQRDKYGRLLAYVWINGEMVNAHLVHRGYAQAATYPPNVRYADYFVKLQGGARDDKRGLWADGGAATAPPSQQAGSVGQPHPAIRFKTSESEAAGSTSTFSSSGAAVAPSTSSSSSGGGSVNVQGYTRSDGTYVAPYTRSAPRGRR